jgi:protein TonB
MDATQEHPFSSKDRLGLSTFVSLLVHMAVILGITFTLPKLREIQGLPTLEVTLVQTRTEDKPRDADFLAQFNQIGGGDTDKEKAAQTPLPVREMSDRDSDLPTQPQLPQKRMKPMHETADLMHTDSDSHRIPVTNPKNSRVEPKMQPRNIGFLQQIDPGNERTRQWTEVGRRWQENQKRPRHKFLHARARQYKYAAYIASWEAKVERIGNLNYPEKIRRLGLSGSVVLDVAIRANGSIYDIHVVRSSGNKLLDDAAIRAARLAAPFEPFPPDIREETDILHLTRTWEFNMPAGSTG